jgi:hypothetical protein
MHRSRLASESSDPAPASGTIRNVDGARPLSARASARSFEAGAVDSDGTFFSLDRKEVHDANEDERPGRRFAVRVP